MLVWTIPPNLVPPGTQLALFAFSILWFRLVLRRILEHFGRPISWTIGTCQRGNVFQFLILYCIGLGVFDGIFRVPRDTLFHFYLVGFAAFAAYIVLWWLVKDYNLRNIGIILSKGPLVLEFEPKAAQAPAEQLLPLLRFMNGLLDEEPDVHVAFTKLMKRLEIMYPDVHIQFGKGGGPYDGYPHPIKHSHKGITLDVTLYFPGNATAATIETMCSTVYFLFVNLVRQYVH